MALSKTLLDQISQEINKQSANSAAFDGLYFAVCRLQVLASHHLDLASASYQMLRDIALNITNDLLALNEENLIPEGLDCQKMNEIIALANNVLPESEAEFRFSINTAKIAIQGLQSKLKEFLDNQHLELVPRRPLQMIRHCYAGIEPLWTTVLSIQFFYDMALMDALQQLDVGVHDNETPNEYMQTVARQVKGHIGKSAILIEQAIELLQEAYVMRQQLSGGKGHSRKSSCNFAVLTRKDSVFSAAQTFSSSCNTKVSSAFLAESRSSKTSLNSLAVTGTAIAKRI